MVAVDRSFFQFAQRTSHFSSLNNNTAMPRKPEKICKQAAFHVSVWNFVRLDVKRNFNRYYSFQNMFLK